jgi:acyl dehydratase
MSDLFASAFDEIEAGQSFSTYGRTITESDLSAFSGLTGDHHPLHTDAEWAAGSQFGERIAHGMLLLSCSVGLAPIDPDRVVALRGFDRVVFKRPVRIGETISLNGRVDSLKSLDSTTGLVRILWRVVNQKDQLVVRAEAEIVWRRSAPEQDPAGAEAGPVPVYL